MSRQVSWNRQLGLALALFILGTAAYWLEFKHKPAKEGAEEQSKKVFNIKEKAVQSLLLDDGKKKLIFTCSDFAAKLCKPGDNSKWEIAEPMKLRADDSNVNALLSTLSTLTPTETFGLKEETPAKKSALLKEYGLDPESRKNGRKIKVNTESGETTLYLGLTHPIGESIFGIKEEGSSNLDEDHVFLIPSFFKANLERDLTHWRDKKLLSLGVHEVQSFKYEGPQARITAERKEGQWVLKAANEELSGDIENIDQFLTTAVYLTAKGFTSDQKNDVKAKAALKGYQPNLTVILQKEKGSSKELPPPVVLTFWTMKPSQKASKAFATVSNLDPLFEIDPSAVTRLTKSLKDFRLTKLISSMDRFSAKRLEFSGVPMGETPLTLTQENGKWINTNDKSPAGAISNEKVQKILDQLSGNRIKNFLVGSEIPSGSKEGLQINLGDDKNQNKRQLLFWKSNGKLYARDLQSKRTEAFLIDPSVQDVLPTDKNFFQVPQTKVETKVDSPKK